MCNVYYFIPIDNSISPNKYQNGEDIQIDLRGFFYTVVDNLRINFGLR